MAQVFKNVILDLESVDLAEKLCWLQSGSMIRSSLRRGLLRSTFVVIKLHTSQRDSFAC